MAGADAFLAEPQTKILITTESSPTTAAHVNKTPVEVLATRLHPVCDCEIFSVVSLKLSYVSLPCKRLVIEAVER